VAGYYEHGNEPSGSIKGERFNYLSDCSSRKDIAPRSQSVSHSSAVVEKVPSREGLS
jgi:hypothetical protein